MNKFNKKRMCLLLAAMLVLTILCGCGKTPEKTEQPVQTVPTEAAEPKLQAREGIQTVLILCLDDYALESNSDSFRNGNVADFAMLMVIDEQKGTITSLQLNPDTVVSFKIPGEPEATRMPLKQVYSYGSGGSDSCLNVTKVVSKLLQGIKVDHYLTFTMDAIGIVNDMIGGVVPGSSGEDGEETVALTGEEAVAFFTERSPEDISNEIHMERQRLYMEGLYEPFMISAQNEDFLTRLSMQLGEKMGTGLTLSQLIAMFETLAAYSMNEEIMTISGKAHMESGEIEFYMDEDELTTVIETLFLS